MNTGLHYRRMRLKNKTEKVQQQQKKKFNSLDGAFRYREIKLFTFENLALFSLDSRQTVEGHVRMTLLLESKKSKEVQNVLSHIVSGCVIFNYAVGFVLVIG